MQDWIIYIIDGIQAKEDPEHTAAQYTQKCLQSLHYVSIKKMAQS